MKKLPIVLIVFSPIFLSFCQPQPEAEVSDQPQNNYENLIVVTLDGLNWTEVFGDEDVLNVRYLENKADLYGNRNIGNQVDVANKSKQSYPGYHEIFTGNTEEIINNAHRNSPHSSVFEFINKQSGYDDINVISVGMGEFTPFLFANGSFPVITPKYAKFRGREFIDPLGNSDFLYDDEINKIIDLEATLEEMIAESFHLKSKIHSYGEGENNEDGELLIYLLSKKLLEKINPKVMYIQFVMTDHFAHLGDWDSYIKSAKNVGIYIQDLIEFISANEKYQNNTAILITTDHGRSEKDFRNHSGESFFILVTPDTGKGVIDTKNQYYNEQFAQTMAALLGFEYQANHTIAPKIELDQN